ATSKDGITLVGLFDGHGGNRDSKSSSSSKQEELSHYMASVVPDVFYKTIALLLPDKIDISTLLNPSSTTTTKHLDNLYPNGLPPPPYHGQDDDEHPPLPAVIDALT
ncbi:hypothetical protein Pmar_PMAR017423, partial [Perkinsus marinus ATCC 50983]